MKKRNNIIVNGVEYELARKKISEDVCDGCSLDMLLCLECDDVRCTDKTIYKKVSEIRKEKIKIVRMQPKERFLYNIMRDVGEIHYDNYPNSIFYRIKDIIYFRYDIDTKDFCCDSENVYNPLLSIDITHNTGTLIKDMAEKYLKISIKDVISTNCIYNINHHEWRI